MTAVAIVALDYPDAGRALRLVGELGDSCRFYKIGSELFTAEGPSVVKAIRDAGCEVFLDLKLHDIPNTVAGAMRGIRELGVRLATVHASGGRAMIEAAVEAAGSECDVFAVTILTSLDGEALAAIVGEDGDEDIGRAVMRLADLAKDAGAKGIVCSGGEAADIRTRFGPVLQLLVPGIRLPGDQKGDQARIVTPEAAVAAGADYLVIGRSVTGAAEPREAMEAVNRKIGKSVQSRR